jgi:hypothetical protein
MKNSILILVFNYSNCLNNREYLINLYKNYFKEIIVYSDYPIINDIKINYVYIDQGHYVHNIFNHFYTNYSNLINNSDGIFYTMDDNIINLNILNLLNTKKIVYYYNEIKPLNKYSGWQWNLSWGKLAIYNLLKDEEFKKYNIDKFSGCFADWFYLPKKYLTDKLFDLFSLFAKHKVFLELAIPSVINNIETNKDNYEIFTDEVLWNNDRIKFLDKNYIYNSFNYKHNLVIHPVKFNENKESKLWLSEIFMKKNCTIITTINKPTETILKHINNKNYDTIIVGDVKTPDDYSKLNCIYLDVNSQKKLFPELADLIPYNHYSRKNLGYLYAIKKGYEIIYETDDDNIPYENFDEVLNINGTKIVTEKNNKWINIYKYFTNNNQIWPRGYPLSLIKTESNLVINQSDKKPAIINGLVENDPDVDALFRLICKNDDIKWETNKSILVDNNNICVFNSQNTFWLNKSLFISMLIPCSVSFRYCDILRSIISNIILKKTNNNIMFSSPNVVQNRNEHNLLDDFKDEYEMYINNENILNIIENNLDNKTDIITIIKIIYKNLLDNKIIKELDITILNKWLDYFTNTNINYNIVFFYSEGNQYDNGINLSYCKEPLYNISKNIFNNVSFYTPRILKSLGYNESVKEFEVTNIIKNYEKMAKIGLSRWKPLIILLELEKMNDGDILLYRDSNIKKYDQLTEYDNIINIINKCLETVEFDVYISRENEDLKLGNYTKPNVIEELGNNDNFVKNFPLLIANFIIIRKSKISIEFLNEWLEACNVDKYIDGHLYNKKNNMFTNFSLNEQSILGVIIAKWVKNRKYNIPKKYPIIGFSHRHINNIVTFNNYDYLKYY